MEERRDVIILSDSDSDKESDPPIRPLTLVRKPKKTTTTEVSRSSTTKQKGRVTKKKHMNGSRQTTISQFFNTLTVQKSWSPVKRVLPEDMYGNVKLTPPLKTTARVTKRESSERLSSPPLSGKMRRTAPKIYNLKGKDLLNAFAPKKLLKGNTTENKPNEMTIDSIDNAFRPLLHFHVNNTSASDPLDMSSTSAQSKLVDTMIDTIDEDISPDSVPVIRPMAKLTLRKKNCSNKSLIADIMTPFSTKNSRLEASTPKKSDISTDDLFSDDSFQHTSTNIFKEEQLPLCEEYGRHTIITYDEGECNTILRVVDSGGTEKTCELRGFWTEAPMKAGDVVNIFGYFDANGYILIDLTQNMIVINPDFLVSGSVIASATQCVRRAVLNNRYKGYDSGNKYMLLGSILHEIFQKVLVSEIRNAPALEKLAGEVAHTTGYAHDMYAIDMAEKSLMEGIDEYIPPMVNFIAKHIGKQSTGSMKIVEIRDIEETVWSPRYGMKGKIDVTVKMQKKSHKVPLELKTGRPTYSAEHKGQVTMYSLMLVEKENGSSAIQERSKPGLLVYLKDGSMQEVDSSDAAVKGLIQLRNELCHGLLLGIDKMSEGKFQVQPLPEPINQERICTDCAHLLTCCLHQKVFKDFCAPAGHVMTKLLPETVQHLDRLALEYFNQWSKMLLLESATEAKWKVVSDIWCKPLDSRSAQGTCISGLVIEVIEQKHTFFLHKLRIDEMTLFAHPQMLAHTKLKVGDNTVISEEDSHVVTLATGRIIEITGNGLVLLIDRKLTSQKRLCVDLYDYYNSGGIGFTNLVRLMENTPESHRMRKNLITKSPPEFQEKMISREVNLILPQIQHLNHIQRQVALKVLLSKDYTVIKGYPGTGKTCTIVALVKCLRSLGQSVVLTSYTNSAVDNILLKLKQENVEFLRLGSSTRIHPLILEHSAEHMTANLNTVDGISSFYSGHHVVAVTCLGVNHAVFARRKFDVCIIDEASQVTQPLILGPLFQAKRFVIVGDSHQLPPLIKSVDAKMLGMDKTMIDSLEDSGACFELTLQYRMNSEIMRLCNKLVYSEKLQCGNESVATACINPNSKIDEKGDWSRIVMSGSLAHSVVMLDTSDITGPVDNVYSDVEASIVKWLCNDLLKVGVACKDIGVITPYQGQVQLLRKILDNLPIEINTVDQYQGRDKQVIIISFVKSWASQMNKGEGILSDIKRLNVAITRAKHKMILVGCITALQAYRPVKALIECLRKDQIIRLTKSWKDNKPIPD